MQGGTGLRTIVLGLAIGAAANLVVGAARADDGRLCVRGTGQAAIDACTRAIHSDRFDQKNLAIIYSNRANQWDRMGELEKAIADHGEALRLDPAYAAGFMHRGNTYARRGDFDRAIADHSEAVRLAPKDATAFYNRGLTFSRKGDHERAVADFTAGIELDARDSRLWGQRCWSRAVIGKELQEALEDCNKARALSPTIPQILAYRGLVGLKLGQYDKALADYDAALAMSTNPNNPGWLYARGVTKVRSGDASGGNADIERARSIKAGVAEEYAKYGVR